MDEVLDRRIIDKAFIIGLSVHKVTSNTTPRFILELFLVKEHEDLSSWIPFDVFSHVTASSLIALEF